MGKLGDLWVKLGLKNGEFKKGIDESKKEVESFSSGLSKMSGVAKAAWAAVAAAVIKFASDAVKMTQKWGDAWNREMEGIKAAYGVFVRQLSSGEGWNNLFQNMAEAARHAKALAAQLDEVFERRISYGYQAANTEKEIAELRLIMNDSSKSDKERQAAANKIIEKEKELGQLKKDINKQEANALRQRVKDQTKLNDEQITFLVEEYNKNREVINQGRKYNEERARLEKEIAAANSSYGTGAMSSASYNAIQQRRDNAQKALADLEKTTSQSIKDVAAATKLYDKGNDELIKGMADAEVAVINVDTEVANAQMRATRLLGSLKKTNTGGKTTDTNADKAASIAQRAEDAARSEVDILTEKYLQEKALLEKYHHDTTALWDEYVQNITKAVGKLDVGEGSISDLFAKMFEDSAVAGALGIDASAIGDAYITRIAEAIAEAGTDELTESIQNEIDKALEGVHAEVLEPVQVDASGLEGFGETLAAQIDKIKQFNEDFNSSVVAGISDGCQEIFDQIMGLREVNPGAVFGALLTPLADLAIRSGEILMAEGAGIEAVKQSLESLNPYVALAAGAALIAIGTAAKAGLQALASAGSSGSSTTASTYQGGNMTGGVENITTELTVRVEGRISGNDIVLSGQRTVSEWGR